MNKYNNLSLLVNALKYKVNIDMNKFVPCLITAFFITCFADAMHINGLKESNWLSHPYKATLRAKQDLQTSRKATLQYDRITKDIRLEQGNVKIIFSPKEALLLPEAQAKKYDYLTNSINNFGKTISFASDRPHFLTKKNIENMLVCSKNNFTSYSGKELGDMFYCADYLCAPKKLVYFLAQSCIDKLSALPHNDPSCKTIQTFIEKHKDEFGLKNYLEHITINEPQHELLLNHKSGRGYCLNLNGDSGYTISSLHDIEYLKTKFPDTTLSKIIAMDLFANNISTYNLNKVLEVLPNLTMLDLSNNAIQHIDVQNIMTMPNKFYMDLCNNPIQSIKTHPYRNTPKSCTIVVNFEIFKKIMNDPRFFSLKNSLTQKKTHTRKFISQHLNLISVATAACGISCALPALMSFTVPTLNTIGLMGVYSATSVFAKFLSQKTKDKKPIVDVKNTLACDIRGGSITAKL